MRREGTLWEPTTYRQLHIRFLHGYVRKSASVRTSGERCAIDNSSDKTRKSTEAAFKLTYNLDWSESRQIRIFLTLCLTLVVEIVTRNDPTLHVQRERI